MNHRTVKLTNHRKNVAAKKGKAYLSSLFFCFGVRDLRNWISGSSSSSSSAPVAAAAALDVPYDDEAW